MDFTCRVAGPGQFLKQPVQEYDAKSPYSNLLSLIFQKMDDLLGQAGNSRHELMGSSNHSNISTREATELKGGKPHLI